MGVIRILDEALASQIAAGEVVERPASVAKELVENSVDAGATRIEVFVDGGGLDRLWVVDDGHGMAAEDAALCFSRHATSKLTDIDELRRLRTYGFRGEALASIGSVAKVRLCTRPAEADAAHEVSVEGGHIVNIGETGSPHGTRVEVNELFYNVPARRKFLKTPRTEASHVESALRAQALALPGVGLRLIVDGARKLDIPPADRDAALDDPRRIERVVGCLGKRVRDYLYPFEGETDLLAVRGYLVAPLETRRDLQGIHLAVNGRPVTDRGLVQAVRVAYRTLLEVGRQPICALDIEIAPELVDVNVHPRKAEVRFEDPRRVHSHVIRLLSDFLATTPWLSRGKSTRTYSLRVGDASLRFEPASDGAPLVDGAAPPAATGIDPDDPAAAHRLRVRDALARFQSRVDGRLPERGRGGMQGASAFAGDAEAKAPRTEAGLGAAGQFSSLRAVGQVGQTFLVLEGPEGMVVIDQHAADERVVFERLRRRSDDGVRSQPLLFPLRLELMPLEMAALEEHAETLASYGLHLEVFGEQTGLVRAVPLGLDAGKAEEIARDALDVLADKGRPDSVDELLDRVCAKMACHGPVRAGQSLDPDDIRALLDELDAIDLGAHGPHGRPVARTLTYAEMAKWFGRS